MSQPCEQYGVGWSPAASIEYERTDFFYDLVVPGEAHYLADGIYSHNTSKTRTILEWIYAAMIRYPGLRVLMMRDRRVDMASTILVEWENEVLGLDHYAVQGGPTREHRERYVLRNGSECRLGGFNNEKKLFSGQEHIIYFNEWQETIEEKSETLHRALRAPGGPFHILIGDCNPDHDQHWLNLRANPSNETFDPLKHLTKRIKTYMWENPRWFNIAQWAWEKDGKEYMRRLRKMLTGPNLDRLYRGLWVPSTGAMLPEYEERVHCIYAELVGERGRFHLVMDDGERRSIGRFFGSADIGYARAGCFQVWGVDDEQRTYRVVEYYHSRWTDNDWAQRMVACHKEFNLRAIVADHDPAFIEECNRALMGAGGSPIVQLADKTLGKQNGKKQRIERLRARLQSRSMFFLRSALREPDEKLLELRRPHCLEKEIPAWRRTKTVYGEDDPERADEPDQACDDHAIDTWSYAEVYAWGRNPLADSLLVQPQNSIRARLERERKGRDGRLIA